MAWTILARVAILVVVVVAAPVAAARDSGSTLAPASGPVSGSMSAGVVADLSPGAHSSTTKSHDGGGISIFWSIPFVLLLLSIALMPFIHRHWWEHHYPKVSVGLALLMALYYFTAAASPVPWLHEMQEYVSFIVLLGALYVVSGGISIRVNRKATPLANVTLLLIGAVVANVFGTTGAAMLLIRPYLRMNRGHIKPYHVVFFIFVVANVGGSLTPIGDPPLFLGYLKGVPFWWVAERMTAPWLMTVGLLAAIFTVIDVWDHRKEARQHDADAGPQVHILGIHNFLFIAAILWAVFRPGVFDAGRELALLGWSAGRVATFVFSRELIMVGAALASRRFTGAVIYEANEFGFGPIREVAILFVGIFSTMVPALQWLEHNAERMELKTAGQFYFASGSLSSFLDNAPTYLTFLQARMGTIDGRELEEARAALAKLKGKADLDIDAKDVPNERARGAVRAMIKYHENDVRNGTVSHDELQVAYLLGTGPLSLFIVAISAGSVFFGACTYIGNGPNFMVKSIADAAGAPTPSFLTYIYKYTLPVLAPVYVLVWVVFFMGK